MADWRSEWARRAAKTTQAMTSTISRLSNMSKAFLNGYGGVSPDLWLFPPRCCQPQTWNP